MAEAPDGIVKAELNEPGLTLDYTTSGALDRFGRVTDHAWNDGTNDIVRIKHGYDRASNRLYREDPVARASTKEWDELYSYDGVNQLTGLERGSLTTTKDSILSQSKNFAEDWSLDATGNWSTFKQDTNGDGTFDLNQSRTHNAANEIVTVASSSSNVAHDLNGNMTTIPQPADWSSNYSLTYDAWNRLAEVKSGQATVAEYAYDGRNHRIAKTANSETRQFFYNQDWQCLEERVDPLTTASIQYIWGACHIDDLVLRDRSSERLYSLADPNWNVVAITDENASVQSRLRYDAYGTASTFNASYASTSLPTGWSYTFTGRRLDSETGCMYYRNRFYHPVLGRFQKRDPIGYRGGMNLFDRSMIVSAVDPMGLSEWVWPWDPDASWDIGDTLDLWGDAIDDLIDAVTDFVCDVVTFGGSECLQAIHLCICGIADIFDIAMPWIGPALTAFAGGVPVPLIFGIAECFLCEIWAAIAYTCEGKGHGAGHLMGTGMDCLVSFMNKYSPVRGGWSPRQLRRSVAALKDSEKALTYGFLEAAGAILQEIDVMSSTGMPSLGHCFRIPCACRDGLW